MLTRLILAAILPLILAGVMLLNNRRRRTSTRLVFESAALAAPPETAIGVFEFAGAATEPLTVDPDAPIIRGVKLIGTVSQNGRRYPAAVLATAVEMYEGAKVNVGHAPGPNITAPRSYHDRLGVMKNVAAREDGLYGDLHYNPKHAVAEQLTWDAKNNPAAVGMSPAHFVRFRKTAGVEVAEDIIRVVSVDLVGDPATTKGLGESIEPQLEEQPAAPAIASVEELTTAYPALIAGVEEAAMARVTVNVAAALKALMAAQLPYNAWDNGMLDAIVVAPTAEQAEAIIGERAALAKRITEQKQTPHAPPRVIAPPRTTTGTIADAKSFAKLIR